MTAFNTMTDDHLMAELNANKIQMRTLGQRNESILAEMGLRVAREVTERAGNAIADDARFATWLHLLNELTHGNQHSDALVVLTAEFPKATGGLAQKARTLKEDHYRRGYSTPVHSADAYKVHVTARKALEICMTADMYTRLCACL